MSESAGKLTDNLWERDRLIPTWVTQGNRPIGDRDSDMRKRGKQTYKSVSLCPISVSRSPIGLFPVASHVGVTLPYYGWGRDTDMGRNRKQTFLGA